MRNHILGQGIDLIRYYTENICQNNPELISRDFLKGLRQETLAQENRVNRHYPKISGKKYINNN